MSAAGRPGPGASTFCNPASTGSASCQSRWCLVATSAWPAWRPTSMTNAGSTIPRSPGPKNARKPDCASKSEQVSDARKTKRGPLMDFSKLLGELEAHTDQRASPKAGRLCSFTKELKSESGPLQRVRSGFSRDTWLVDQARVPAEAGPDSLKRSAFGSPISTLQSICENT